MMGDQVSDIPRQVLLNMIKPQSHTLTGNQKAEFEKAEARKGQ